MDKPMIIEEMMFEPDFRGVGLSSFVRMVWDNDACNHIFSVAQKLNGKVPFRDIIYMALCPHQATCIEYDFSFHPPPPAGYMMAERVCWLLRRSDDRSVKVKSVFRMNDELFYPEGILVYNTESGSITIDGKPFFNIENKWETYNQMGESMIHLNCGMLLSGLAIVACCPVMMKVVRPSGRLQLRNQTGQFKSYANVTIKISIRECTINLRKANIAAKKRRHMVREHYRIYHRNTPQEKKVIIPEHLRGDSGVGWVDRGYTVTGA